MGDQGGKFPKGKCKFQLDQLIKQLFIRQRGLPLDLSYKWARFHLKLALLWKTVLNISTGMYRWWYWWHTGSLQHLPITWVGNYCRGQVTLQTAHTKSNCQNTWNPYAHKQMLELEKFQGTTVPGPCCLLVLLSTWLTPPSKQSLHSIGL